MANVRLNLLVLRVADIERSVAFYRLMGIVFTKHAHGTGPEHYAAELPGGCVLELYPATAEQPATVSTRIGFAVADVDAMTDLLGDVHRVKLISPPKNTEWGRRAILTDPDGHRIELTAALSASAQ